MAILVACIGTLIIGLIVFGGGQVFMPLFKSLWEFMGKIFHLNITNETINNIFTIANSTPGVLGTKLAAISGYLSANGQWWGWLVLLLTYLIFSVPSIFMVLWAYKAITKSNEGKYLNGVILYLRPVIVGILFTIAVQLFIGAAFPNIIFNSSKEYVGYEKHVMGWRYPLIITYSIVAVVESFYLYHKKNVSLLMLIIIHLIIGMLLFEPWLSNGWYKS